MNFYERFKQLHYDESPLLLANVWNVKSACIAESSGFKAIATTSGAIAESLGYKDGEHIPFSELLYLIKRIRASTTIPLSVDFERGYADDIKILVDNIQQLIDIGVAGINLEDANGEDIYLRKLEGISNYLVKTGQQLFINARTDVFLQKLDSPLETTLRRADRYQDAGADGLFVTGIQDKEIIRQIASGTALPLNVVAISKLSSIGELADCGVKRVSMAVFLYNATYAKMEIMAQEILSTRSTAILF